MKLIPLSDEPPSRDETVISDLPTTPTSASLTGLEAGAPPALMRVRRHSFRRQASTPVVLLAPAPWSSTSAKTRPLAPPAPPQHAPPSPSIAAPDDKRTAGDLAPLPVISRPPRDWCSDRRHSAQTPKGGVLLASHWRNAPVARLNRRRRHRRSSSSAAGSRNSAPDEHHKNPLRRNMDMINALADFVHNEDFIFFAGVCRSWRRSWGHRPTFTRVVTAHTSTSQLLLSFECDLRR